MPERIGIRGSEQGKNASKMPNPKNTKIFKNKESLDNKLKNDWSSFHCNDVVLFF